MLKYAFQRSATAAMQSLDGKLSLRCRNMKRTSLPTVLQWVLDAIKLDSIVFSFNDCDDESAKSIPIDGDDFLVGLTTITSLKVYIMLFFNVKIEVRLIRWGDLYAGATFTLGNTVSNER